MKYYFCYINMYVNGGNERKCNIVVLYYKTSEKA